MNFKRTIATLLICSTAAFAGACGGGEDSSSDGGSADIQTSLEDAGFTKVEELSGQELVQDPEVVGSKITAVEAFEGSAPSNEYPGADVRVERFETTDEAEAVAEGYTNEFQQTEVVEETLVVTGGTGDGDAGFQEGVAAFEG